MTRKWLVVFLALAGAALLWQWVAIRTLTAQSEQLRAELAQAEAMHAQAAQTALQPRSADDGLQAEQAELNRLRGEVSQLRKDIKAAQLANAKRAAESRVTNSPVSLPEVQKYAAEVHANVPFNQTLVTGGWKLPSGKHAFFFIEPQPGGGADQVTVKTKIVELPGELLASVGLEALKSDSAEMAGQLILDDARARQVIQALEQQEGVTVLGAPTVLTLSGRQAQVKIANSVPTAEGGYAETGPLLDIVPTVSPDGTSADLQLTAQMRLPFAR